MSAGSHNDGDKKGVRLDKWLWAARCFKTRSQATTACSDGHCRVDGSISKAGYRVRPGQSVQVKTAGGLRVLEVIALAEKRGSVAAAQALFIDHTPPEPEPDPMERVMRRAQPFHREKGEGRPTKRDRRVMDKARWES